MGSKHLGADLNLAWPTAQVAVMGAQGAVNILFRKEITGAKDPVAERADKISEYEEAFDNPYVAAERGWIDAVIAPSETRIRIIRGLRQLITKRESMPPKKHGNIPL
jgi:propionyl-CoA carboxylase beta chain